MSITLTTQITVSSGSDPLGNTQVRFSNGYEAQIPNSWGSDAINAEIQNIINRFDSNTPPINWIPYVGYTGS